ncbi:NAD(P)H-binding protein [Streptomyces radicis]|uniref:Ergot alkaloid biosynthesis protein n=1 Tax=Streptomyces radicis TaxID=1750517 RepID=A0A3A9W3U3_9ACTN|nr:NAD(P)H-binding protein [Streptomyces radicis]RKN07915.1 ergot alkaloid biosynthesis protein [Streptomyces radicis]RKN20631.1 ergot alkaloid biosynthesis protein [Streptomyces radicis]
MSEATVLVTGATGTIGGRITAGLLAEGRHRVRAASRGGTAAEGAARPVRFDWYEPATHAAALEGADRVHLIAPIGDPEPAAVMLPFLEQARAAGVRRVVLLSASLVESGDPGLGEVQAALPQLFAEWAALRPSWFMQNLIGDHHHARTLRDEGLIRTATGEGRVGFVDADDIAAVAVRALSDERSPDAELVLTGPEALSYAEVAAVIAEVTGRDIRHVAVSADELGERLTAVMPPRFAALLAAMDRAIAEGAEDRTTDAVERVTGRPPGDFRAFAARAW